MRQLARESITEPIAEKVEATLRLQAERVSRRADRAAAALSQAEIVAEQFGQGQRDFDEARDDLEEHLSEANSRIGSLAEGAHWFGVAAGLLDGTFTDPVRSDLAAQAGRLALMRDSVNRAEQLVAYGALKNEARSAVRSSSHRSRWGQLQLILNSLERGNVSAARVKAFTEFAPDGIPSEGEAELSQWKSDVERRRDELPPYDNMDGDIAKLLHAGTVEHLECELAHVEFMLSLIPDAAQ